MNKSGLRQIFLKRQEALTPDECDHRSRQITDLFFENFDLSTVKVLHCFIAIEKFNEINTSSIFQRLWTEFQHIETVVPRVNFKTGEIESLKLTTETQLVPNKWQIREPSHAEYVETSKIDVVLVPLVCLDKAGNRVGYGKGFYDRFLNKCRPDCVKIGLSYFPPLKNVEDVGKHDIKLDRCITPVRIFEFGKYKDSTKR